MKFSKKILFCLFLAFFSGFFVFQVKTVKASETDTPVIVEATSHRMSATSNYVYLTGLTAGGTEVLIYIDGEFFDTAKINSENTETDNFYYQSKALSEGEHSLMILARNKKTMVLSVPVEKNIVVPSLSAPTLIKPNQNDSIGKPKPFITGLSVSETVVHIYIDGVYNGKTDFLNHESGVASFAYLPFLNLGKGEHKVWAVSEDKNGKKSRSSNTLIFKIEDPMPAPTMFDPVANFATTKNKPFIIGLAKNDSLIKVYIDDKIDGQFKVKNHESGTANFAYKPLNYLSDGQHKIYAVSVNFRGKESIASNVVDFQVFKEFEKKIENLDKAENKNENEKQILGEKINDEESQSVGGIEDGSEKKENKEDVRIDEEKKLLDSDNIEENKKFEINPELIIFIVFVLGVIVWIIWVNRELAKEKEIQAENKKSENDIEKASDDKKDSE